MVGCMNKSLTLNLPDGKQILFEYPHSPLMEGVLRSIFVRNGYPPLPFLQSPG